MTEAEAPRSVSPLRAMRERSGLSLREVSRRSEINPGRLSILERGVEPTADEMDKIATVLRDAALLTEMER